MNLNKIWKEDWLDWYMISIALMFIGMLYLSNEPKEVMFQHFSNNNPIVFMVISIFFLITMGMSVAQLVFHINSERVYKKYGVDTID